MLHVIVLQILALEFKKTCNALFLLFRPSFLFFDKFVLFASFKAVLFFNSNIVIFLVIFGITFLVNNFILGKKIS